MANEKVKPVVMNSDWFIYLFLLLFWSDEDETLGGLYEVPPAPPAKPTKRIASPPPSVTPKRMSDRSMTDQCARLQLVHSNKMPLIFCSIHQTITFPHAYSTPSRWITGPQIREYNVVPIRSIVTHNRYYCNTPCYNCRVLQVLCSTALKTLLNSLLAVVTV